MAETIWTRFLPLVAILVQRHDIKRIEDLRPLQVAFRDEWGLEMPYHALAALLNRARRRGLFTRSTKVSYPSPARLREFSATDVADDRRSRVESLLQTFSDFAKLEFDLEVELEEAESTLICYLRRHSDDLHLLIGSSSPLPDVAPSQSLLYVFGRFANRARVSASQEFKTLIEVWLGHALVEAVVLPSPGKLRGKLKKLSLFVDTPVIFAALGFSGEESKHATLELLQRAVDHGALLKYFHHTYDELFGILESTIPWLSNLRNYDPSRAGLALRHCVDNGVRPSDIEQLLANLEKRLTALGLVAVAGPRAVPNLKYQIDEEKLEAIIREIYWSTPTDLTIERDVQSISAIYRLRKDRLPRQITHTRFVFLTTNHSLARASRRYEEEYVSEAFFVPAAITDVFLGTLLWLESPQTLESVHGLKLISDIQGLLEPSEALLKRFAQTVEELGNSGRISSDEVVALRTSPVARELLQEITRGDPLSFSHQTAEEILEQLKDGVRVEERRAGEERLGLALDAARRDERRLARSRIEAFASRVGKFVARGLFGVLAFLAIGLIAFLTLGPGVSGWVGWLAIALSIGIGALSVIVPVSDLWSICSGVEQRFASALVQRLIQNSDR